MGFNSTFKGLIPKPPLIQRHFIDFRLLELTDPVCFVLRYASLFVLLVILSSVLRTKRPDVLK